MITVRSASGFFVSYETSKFPGGEIHVEIKDSGNHKGPFTIDARVCSSDDIFLLLLLTDAIRRKYSCHDVDLILPYVPYGRQDRVCKEGQSLSLKVFCELINSQMYRSVTIWDPHSDVTGALLDHCKIINQLEFTKNIPWKESRAPIVVAPDQGASKKAQATAKYLGTDLIVCSKERTGRDSLEIKIPQIEDYGDFLIVDDICDGGRTFIEIVKELKFRCFSRKIYLYVTHGIFSRGLSPLKEAGIEHVYCANVWPGILNNVDITHITR